MLGAAARRGRSVPSAGPEQVHQVPAQAEETLALRAGVEKRLVGREPLAPDDALGEVAALERRDLRGAEARGAVHAPVALVEVQHVLLQLELDRALAREQAA